MERVCIFIDGSNFYHGLKNQFGITDIKFDTFTQKLCDGRNLIRVYYYNSPVNISEAPDAYKKQQKFFAYLKRVPYFELRLGKLVKRSKYIGGQKISFTQEKGVDVYLATDMLKNGFNNLYDTAILVSGDGDFADAVQAVKDIGKHVELAHFSTGDSHLLKEKCDVCKQITRDWFD